jgi:hypothetical protein
MNADAPAGPFGCLRSLAALAVLVGWAALLLTPVLAAHGVAPASIWDLRSLEASRGSRAGLLSAVALAALAFAPLGAAAVFVFADRGSRLLRSLLVGLPAFVLGVAATVGVLWVRDRAAGGPGASDLLLPVAGVWLGVLAGLSLRRGLFSLLFLPLRLALGVAAVALVAAVLLLVSLDREPLVPEPHAVTTDDKRRIVAAFRGRDPRTIPPGETRTLRLTQADADGLAAWALPLVWSPSRVRAAAVFAGPDEAVLRASVRVPLVGWWLDTETRGRVRVDDGRVSLREPRLRVGRREVPAGLLEPLAPLLELVVQHERPLRPLLGVLRRARIEAGAAEATYGRVELPRGLVAGLVWGEGASEGLREAVAGQVRGILAALAAAPAGDGRLTAAYEDAFRRAGARPAGVSAVEANRAALLGLGVVLGSGELTTFTGDVADSGQKLAAVRLRAGATAHARADWTRHFSLSGAITVLTAIAPSDAAGLLKEELDADGGSGFSFGDLLADRAGTSFAALATRDEASAAALQRRVAAGFRLDDYLPAADGLPENIADAELRARYGGVGGPLFRRYADDIERRLAAAPGYR